MDRPRLSHPLWGQALWGQDPGSQHRAIASVLRTNAHFVTERPSRALSAAVLALLLAALPACYRSHTRGDARDGSIDAPRDAAIPLTLEAFAAEWGRVTCERVVFCAAGAENNAWHEAAPDVACERIFPIPERAELERAAARGTLVFDPDAAARCLAARATSCAFGDLQRTCPDVIRGTVPIGSECRSLVECVPGAICDAPVDAGRCGGTCRAETDAGGACDVACRQCFADRCVDLLPPQMAGEGEPCGLTEGGAPLSVVEHRCGPDLYCVRECRPFLELGEPCSLEEWPSCAGSLVCADGRCVPQRVETEPGAPCGGTVLCDRFHRLLCEGGACVRIGGGAGARCATPWGDLDCDPGTRCDPIAERCVPATDPPPSCDP